MQFLCKVLARITVAVFGVLLFVGLGFSFASAQDAVGEPAVEKKFKFTGPAAEVEVFLDDFFDRFATYSKSRRGSGEDRAMIPLLRFTKSKIGDSPATIHIDMPVDPAIGIIAKLWIHGPKSWQIADMQVLGDTAYAKVFFQSVQTGRTEPIPFGFQFIKARGDWKISGYVDMRSATETGQHWQQLIVTKHEKSPESVFTDYMDKIEKFYAPSQAKESMKIAPQVQENLSPLWIASDEAAQSSSRAMMTFSQLQPRNWQLVSSDFPSENAELVITASAGNPVMRRNMGMAAMMGSGLKFTLEKADDSWLLKSYGRSSR